MKKYITPNIDVYNEPNELVKLLFEKGYTKYPMSYDGDYWFCYIQLAMRWLREIYDLHIIAYPFKSGNDTSTKHYCCQVFKTFNLLGYEKYTNETLTSYEEAVETAIKYCLENLIK